MEIKLFDSELKVMEVLWDRGDLTAKELAGILGEEIGWNVNTTYTVIKKCVAKGAIQRTEPRFRCHPLVTRKEVRQYEAAALVDKVFDGSPSLLFASLLEGKKLPQEELERLRRMVEELK